MTRGAQVPGSNDLSWQRSDDSNGDTLEKMDTVKKIGFLKLRGETDDLPQDWWFASTAIPLLAATIGPMASVFSIAALVTQWRQNLPDDGQLPEGTDDNGVGFDDPHWVIVLNALSLACGFVGNVFLLFNFTRRVRYIVALPMTVIFWSIATGLLIGITSALNLYKPPVRPGQTYSQGFWYAIIAAVCFLLCALLLGINILGYLRGHYPAHFELDDDQRTLILQTMMFFVWLAGGGGVFSTVCHWSYVDALYFCDVTILTVGFGDFVAPNDVARGLIFPYSVGGIISLGLVINSLRKFAANMSRDKIIKRHQQRVRERTLDRTVTNERELRERLGLPPRRRSSSASSMRSRSPMTVANVTRRVPLPESVGQLNVNGQEIIFQEARRAAPPSGRGGAARTQGPSSALAGEPRRGEPRRGPLRRLVGRSRANERHQRLLLLREEKDRFEAMRSIQKNTHNFQKYYNLSISILAFGALWCLGAMVFMYAEHRIQDLSYFEALYFCYVSLLTIGYGDLSPRSNAGKPFFVVWSLIAVPTMTILVSDLGDTFVAAYDKGTVTLAEWTVMPRSGVVHDFLEHHPQLRDLLAQFMHGIEEKRRIKHGFDVQDPDEPVGVGVDVPTVTIEDLADVHEPTEHELARKLALAIKHTANDLHASPPKKYSYEEWVEFTRLIRFSSGTADEVREEEDDEGLIRWDWIGEDSPMLSDETEAQWVLDRLCESLNRYTRRQDHKGHHRPHRPLHLQPDEAVGTRRAQRPRSRLSIEEVSRAAEETGDLHDIRARHEQAWKHDEARL